VNICVPTTLKEWQAADEADGPFLLVSLTKEKTPRWVSTNSQGECESFDALDGALLWALGLIDVRTSPQNEEEAMRQRHLYDRHGAAIAFLENIRRKLDAEAEVAETEG
jgi:hypothetical protein